MIQYDNFWKTLQLRGISQYTLIHRHGISASRLHALRRGDYVRTDLILKLCLILSCEPDALFSQRTDKAGHQCGIQSGISYQSGKAAAQACSLKEIPTPPPCSASVSGKTPCIFSYEPFFALLKANSISQNHLLEAEMISAGTLRRLRHGKTVSLYTLDQLSRCLGCDIHALYRIKFLHAADA